MPDTLVLRPRGAWISHLTSTDPHPLDFHVDGLRRRSEESFRAVYEATADSLASFAFGMVGDRRTAEDIVQQAFLELVRAAPRLRGDGRALRSWLYRAVRFGCLDEYRRRRRRPEVPDGELPEVRYEQDMLAGQLDPHIESALLSLSKRHRTVVLLRHVADLNGEEIAAILGVSRRAAYATVARAERALRAALGEMA